MKKLYKIKNLIFGIILIMNSLVTISQVCNPAGNVIVFSNYDGSKETTLGRLNIVVDVNIPNLKIGICSYERVTVNISGPYAGNVTSVIYAGYGGTVNCNCYYPLTPVGCHATTTITGVPTGTVSYAIMPPSTYLDVNGYNNIICSYQCVPGSNGGCNTPGQVVSYFTNAFSGTFRSHTTQYGCWNGATFSVSTTGNCCMTAPCTLPVSGAVVGTNSICAGSTNTYSVAPLVGATSYNWTLPGGWIGTSTTNSISTTASSSAGTISVTVSNACGTSSASVKAITVNALPTLTIAASSSTICSGQSVILTASTTATSYSWNTGATTMTTSVSPTLTSIYSASVTGSGGCISNTANCTVFVNTNPIVVALTSNSLICRGASAILTASSSATSYTWNTGATTMSVSVSPSVTSTYTVSVSNAAACVASSTVIVTVSPCTGINEILENAVSVYPNPANGVINVDLTSELTKNSSLEVYDALGKLVVKQVLANELNSINISSLSNGVYTFKILNKAETIKTGKFIKQ